MPNVAQILDYLWTLAPKSFAMEHDNPGLQCGRIGNRVNRILVALDPFFSVAEEANAVQADLVVTHHPVTFGLKNITDADETGRTLLYLIERRIALIAMHTNLDAAQGGVNDCLAQCLGLQNTSVLDPMGMDMEGKAYGIGRVGTVSPCELATFLEQVKSALGCPVVHAINGGKPVHRVAVGGGSCSGMLAQVAALGCDTFVTADVKYNGFADARALGISMIDAGHYYTEQVICTHLAKKLASAFPDVEVLCAKTKTECAFFA